MLRNLAFALFFLTMIFAAPMALAAGVYHWVDSQGNVHFGDVPHRGANTINVRVWKPSPHPAAAGAKTADSDAGARVGSEMTPAQQCALARKQYRKYKNADSLVEVNQFGEKHTLNKSQRQKAVTLAKSNVGKYCSG